VTPETTQNAAPSQQVVNVLAAAVRRAARLGAAAVGTEHLYLALADSLGPGRALQDSSTCGWIMAMGTDNWVDDDAGPGGAPDAAVVALLRQAHHRARQTTILPESGALRECLRAALASATGGVLTTADVALALLELPSGRAAEALQVRRVDVPKRIAAVRSVRAEPEEAPAVALLRRSGMLEGHRGGGWARWITRLLGRDDALNSRLLLVVRHEAERHALRRGRPVVEAVDLVAAVLTVDDQIAAAGHQLRPEHVDRGAAALRAAGVDPVALLDQPLDPVVGEAERALAGTRLVAARRGEDMVMTTHLLMALLNDPADPIGPALRGIGIDPTALRASLPD
jgi:hypothetical protein